MASHTNFRELAKAKSRTSSAWKTHVFFPFGFPFSAAFASSGVTMKRGFFVEASAFFSRSRCTGVRTSSSFCKEPVAATM